MQTFERWEPVQVRFAGEWIEGRYLETLDHEANPSVLPEYVHVVMTFALGMLADQGFTDDQVRPMPIRRGDVVQVIEGEYCGTIMLAVGDPDPMSRVWLKVFDLGIFLRIESLDVIRIGRAAYYPDGTKVEE